MNRLVEGGSGREVVYLYKVNEREPCVDGSVMDFEYSSYHGCDIVL